MKHLNLTPPLYDYMLDISLREHEMLAALRKETAKLPLANMQVAPEQAQFFQFLLQLISAHKVLEIGTFTGYCTLAMALALPEDGQVVTCDINSEWTQIATSFWQKAKQNKKIQLRLKPAIDSLNELIQENQSHSFDFIFIDADKTNYLNYYELALKLVSPKGLIAVDNVFWDGLVIDPTDQSGQTREIRRLNEFIKNDKRIDLSWLAISDGVLLIKPKAC